MFDKNSVHSMLSALKWRMDHPSDHHGVIKNIRFQILRTVFKSFNPVDFSISGVLGSIMALAVSQWPLGSMRPCCITMDPWFHGGLYCQNGLLGPMRFHGGTMVSLDP